MANIKVRDLADTTTITSDNQIMVLTNDQNNLVQNITVGNFNQNIISTQTDNGITQGSDGGLYVNNADSGVTAGTYQYPQNLVVDSKGKITGVINGTPAAVPIATSSTVGTVKPDNTTITVANDGTITAIQRNIGEIVASTIPLTDAGLHLLDGALINGSGIYSAFVDYIASIYDASASYFTTETSWQDAVTNYGVCGKFVYDSVNNTVRLPKITGFVEGVSDITNLGNLTLAGLPNITGTITGDGYNNTNSIYWGNNGGALYTSRNTSASVANYASSVLGNSSIIGIDASRSSSIYGRSNTVQPQSVKALYYIVIATSTKTDIQVDIDEIATDLNGKVDKSSLTEVIPVIAEYVYGQSGYRIWSSGYCEQWGYSSIQQPTINFLKTFANKNYVFRCQGIQSGGAYYAYGETRTTNSVAITSNFTSGIGYWIASGYLASGEY